MRDTATTPSIIKNTGSTAAQFNTICDLALVVSLENAHPVISGQPRRFTRRDTEAFVLAIGLHSAGLSPKRIRAILPNETISRISRELRLGANYLVVYPNKSVSAFHDIENAIADKRSGQFPTITLDLADVRNRVERAILDAEGGE